MVDYSISRLEDHSGNLNYFYSWPTTISIDDDQVVTLKVGNNDGVINDPELKERLKAEHTNLIAQLTSLVIELTDKEISGITISFNDEKFIIGIENLVDRLINPRINTSAALFQLYSFLDKNQLISISKEFADSNAHLEDLEEN